MNKLIAIIVLAIPALATAGRTLPPHPIDPTEMERGYHESRRQREEDRQTVGEATHDALDTAGEWGNWGVETYVSLLELADAYHTLTAADRTCMDLGTLGAPEVPASCGEDEGQCSQCYKDAYRELDEARFKLEKLRCIYTATKGFADKAIAFGDTSSGIHAVVGMEWQIQKKNIQNSVDELNKSYDAKYGEFVPKLKAALEHVGSCEEQFYNERDWYIRFGYIYFTFMSDRYKRIEK